MSVVDKPTLMDVPAYTMKNVDELATILVSKLEQAGDFDTLHVSEQVELRLLRTLLDGFA